METFSALLALCVGNSPVTCEFPSQRPVTRSFDVSLICAWINASLYNRGAGDLSRHRAHYDVIVMQIWISPCVIILCPRRSVVVNGYQIGCVLHVEMAILLAAEPLINPCLPRPARRPIAWIHTNSVELITDPFVKETANQSSDS